MRSAFPLTKATGERYSVLTQGAGASIIWAPSQIAAALNPTPPST